MKNVIKLTAHSWVSEELSVLIGTESIIKASEFTLRSPSGQNAVVTKIESRGAMVTTTYVTESVEEIYEMCGGNK